MADEIQVGNRTLVKRIIFGTPVRTAVISNAADIDAITGLNTSGAIPGSTFVYDSDAGEWVASNTLTNITIDGLEYPSDSDRAEILIRRSGTAGDPLTLRQGELAYSWLADSATDGFGNGGDRLYIGVGLETESDGTIRSARIDTIGGKYFTDLLNHQHGIVTPSSAIIVDSNGAIDELEMAVLAVTDSATIRRLYVPEELILSALNVPSLTFDSATGTVFAINDLTVSGSTSLDSVTVSGSLSVAGPATFLDSATIPKLTVTELVATRLTIDSAAFDSSDFVNLNVTNQLTVEGKTLSEYIDSNVADLLVEGEGIDIVYSDSANSITISAELASSTNAGIALFDSSFAVDSSGGVSIIVIDAGSFE